MKLLHCPDCDGSQFAVETAMASTPEERLMPPEVSMAMWCVPCGKIAATADT